jgi:beta-phosphoglucomutase-like phosphatase (HAD superfamily)
MVVVSRNRGGAYIICDLDGTLAHAPVAAFRVVPYFARHELDVPDLESHLDVSVARLRELERTADADPDDPEVAAVLAESSARALDGDDAVEGREEVADDEEES